MQKFLVAAILSVSFSGFAKQSAKVVKPQVEQPAATSSEAQSDVAKSQAAPVQPPKNETPKQAVDRMDKEVKEKLVTNRDYRTKVDQVIDKNKKDVKACQKEIKPKKGRMLITWEISEKGQAQSFSKGDDTLNNERLYHCIIHKIENWKFTPPPYERAMDIEHMFSF